MKKWLFLFLLLSPSVARAELVTPQFTQGSMNSTTTTTQEIVEDITITTYGSVMSKWSGDNITHTSTSSGGIADSDSVFNMTTAVIAVTTTTVTQSLFEPIKKKVQKQLQAKVNKWKENRKKKRNPRKAERCCRGSRTPNPDPWNIRQTWRCGLVWLYYNYELC